MSSDEDRLLSGAESAEEIEENPKKREEESAIEDEQIGMSEESDSLDDEDLELIAENLGPKAALGMKKREAKKHFRRIKRRKQIDNDNETNSISNNDDSPEMAGSHKRLETTYSSEAQLDEDASGNQRIIKEKDLFKKSGKSLEHLFDDEDEEQEDSSRVATRDSREYGSQEEEEQEDEEDDNFIVDDDEGLVTDSKVAVVPRKSFLVKPSRKKLQDDEEEAEMEDIFGHVDEYIFDDAQRTTDRQDEDSEKASIDKDALLEHVYEPSLLAERFMTPRDELIRQVDLPERFILREPWLLEGISLKASLDPSRPITDEIESKFIKAEDALKETVWLANQYVMLRKDRDSEQWLKDRSFLKAVSEFRRFIREEGLEVPYIAMHRQDYMQWKVTLSNSWGQPEATEERTLGFSVNDLWLLYDLDYEWQLMKRLEEQLLRLMDLFELELRRKQESSINLSPWAAHLLERYLIKCGEWRNQLQHRLQDMNLEDLEAIQQWLQVRLRWLKKAKEHELALLGFLLERIFLINIFGQNCVAHLARSDVFIEPIASEDQNALKEMITAVGQEEAFSLVAREIIEDPSVQKGVFPVFLDELRVTVLPEIPVNLELTVEQFLQMINQKTASSASISSSKTISPWETDTCLVWPMACLKDIKCSDLNDESWTILIKAERERMVQVELKCIPQQEALDELKSYLGHVPLDVDNNFDSNPIRIFRDNLWQRVIQGLKDWMNKEGKRQRSKLAKRWLKERVVSLILDKCLVAPLYHDIVAPESMNSLPSDRPSLRDAFGRNGLVLAVEQYGKSFTNTVVSFQGIFIESSSHDEVDDFLRYCESWKGILSREFSSVENTMSENSAKLYIVTHDKQTFQSVSRALEHFSSLQSCIYIGYYEDDTAMLLQDFYVRELEKLQPSLCNNQNASTSKTSTLGYLYALARKALNPLGEYCLLYCVYEKKLFNENSWKFPYLFHPCQDWLAVEDGNASFERALVTVVNIVGVDINWALQDPLYEPHLVFVCGLGPRKSAHLKSMIKNSTTTLLPGKCVKRAEIQREKWLSKRVTHNMLSFVYIQEASLDNLIGKVPDVASTVSSSEGTSRGELIAINVLKRKRVKNRTIREALDCLDMTRIHPEHYDLAKKMAADALDMEQDVTGTTVPGGTSGSKNIGNSMVSAWQVEQLWNDTAKTYKLQQLLLDGFAKELERTKGILKLKTLSMIREEFISPYHEQRISLRQFFGADNNSLSPRGVAKSSFFSEQGMWRNWSLHPLFEPYLLAPGTPFLCQIKIIKDRWLKCRFVFPSYLSSSVSAMYFQDLNNRNASQSRESLVVAYKTNQLVVCTLITIERDKGTIIVSRPIPLTSLNTPSIALEKYRIDYPPFMPGYDISAVSLIKRGNVIRGPSIGASRNNLKNSAGQRLIQHPCFHSFSRMESESYLNDPMHSPILFRPSSKGHSHLVASIRLLHPQDIQSYFSASYHDGPNNNCNNLNISSVFLHIDINEEKDPLQPVWCLGKTLYIQQQRFDDLDEIIARYLEPFLMAYRDILLHAKSLVRIQYERSTESNRIVDNQMSSLQPYVDPTVPQGCLSAEIYLKAEKSKFPKRIPYVFGPSFALPGKFFLAWLRPTVPPKPTFECISILPLQGFKFRNVVYGSLNELITVFKQTSANLDINANTLNSNQLPGSAPPQSSLNAPVAAQYIKPR